MNFLKLTFFVVLLPFIFGSHSASAYSKLRTGDVLLISLNCYSCALIERSTGAPYSHSALVFEHAGQWRVAQALGLVHDIAIDEFLSLRKEGTKIAVLRPLIDLSNDEVYQNYLSFKGMPFDRDYLWDDEKLYCSEFIAKFFQRFDSSVLTPNPIDYGNDDEIWRRHLGERYNGGEPGNSPASLLENSFFRVIDFF